MEEVTEGAGQKRSLDGINGDGSRPRRKRGKKTTCDPPPAPDPNRCHFYLERKRRYCRGLMKQGRQFCGEHCQEDGEGMRRVPCPLDPMHTVFEKHLANHVKFKCNKREGIQPVYFTKDINSGIAATGREELSKATVQSAETAEVLKMVKRVRSLYKEHIPTIREEILFHEALREEVESPSNGASARKHLLQNASLVAHLEKLGLLGDHHCYIEFGAGKGRLSHWVQKALPTSEDTQFVLVEKSSVRYKMDSFHKGQENGPSFERLRINIQHLDLSKVESLRSNERPIVGLGKHLCGGATDLMLRCLMGNKLPSNKESKGRIVGVVLSLCCHHQCDWTCYVGKDFFEELGLSARDMHILSTMTAWATCGSEDFIKKLKAKETELEMTKSSVSSNDMGNINDDTEKGSEKLQTNFEKASLDAERTSETLAASPRGNPRATHTESSSQPPEDTYDHPRYGSMTPAERKEVGGMCKRLLDYGRVKYLQKHGYNARLVLYTDETFSLENYALLATCNS